MAITQTTYTGNGSTTNYSFTFEYLKQADVKVTLDTVATTAFTFANATTIAFTTAPGNGVAIRIFRDTAIDTLSSTFFPGSAIKAEDLNQNFTQNLYVTQEADFNVGVAEMTADTAVTTANSAVTTANGAVTTANSANTKSDAAVATANTADTNASAAVTTANTASTNATNAVNTANTASTNATAAVNTANTASTNATTAVNTANSAATDAASAVSTANSATTTANTALSTANTASTTANSAVTTANTADTNASAAVTTANTASTNASSAVATATAAQNAVAAAAFYTPVANVAGIPSSPSDQDRVEVADSTGIQSFTPLAGYPSGFTGSSGLTARIQYSTSGSTWNWVDYFANDPENRYFIKTSGDTNTTNIATNTTNITTNTTNIATNTTNIATKMPLAGGTFTGAVNFDDDVVVKGDSTNGSGEITLNCENNSHGVKIKGPPHAAAANYTLTLPSTTGTNGQYLKTDGSGNLDWVTEPNYELTLNTGTSVALSGSSGNPDVLTTLMENVVIRRDYSTHSFVYKPQYISDNVEIRGDKTLRFQVNSGGGGAYTGFKKDPSATTSVDFTLPDADGSSGQALTTNGSGVLNFSTISTIAICDGGNFSNGSSLVQTSTTFDGGSF